MLRRLRSLFASQKKRDTMEGFSIVEVAVVIFMVGLAAGSIVAGGALVEQAKLRSFLLQVRDLQARIAAFEAVHNFKPGDYPNASDLWGIDSCGGTHYGANGNGDGTISYALLERVPQRHDAVIESYLAWCHLAMANLGSDLKIIKNLETTPVSGVHLPKTKLGGSFHLTSGSKETFGLPEKTNAIIAGKPAMDMTTPGGFLSPKRAMRIDQKIDTGVPDTGNVRSRSGKDANKNSQCLNTENNAYHLSHSKNTCVMSFALNPS